MLKFEIHLFGKFCVRYNGQSLYGFDARKIQDLFCYLLLHRDQVHSREMLASLLWPESTTEHSKKNLRQILWQLQRALRSTNQSIDDWLLVELDQIQLAERADLLWLDVAVLEEAGKLVQKIAGRDIDAQRAQVLEDATLLYRGPLLEGCYEDWCMCERERLQRIYLALLDKLMEYCEAQLDYETGILYGMRIISCNRACERTHQRLMRLYCLKGDRTAALQQFTQCTSALEEEFDAKPTRSTVKLYEQIRADQLPQDQRIIATHDLVTARAGTPDPLPVVLNRLTQIQTTLSDLQNEIEQSIQKLKEVLPDSNFPSDSV